MYPLFIKNPIREPFRKMNVPSMQPYNLEPNENKIPKVSVNGYFGQNLYFNAE